MSEVRIVAYDEAYRDAIIGITLTAWAPVFEKTASEVPRFVYDCFYPSGWKARQEQEVRSLLAIEPENFWLALAADEPAGFVGIRLHPEDMMGEIHILTVSPPLQRQGIGRCLMVHAENLMPDLPCGIVKSFFDMAPAGTHSSSILIRPSPWYLAA